MSEDWFSIERRNQPLTDESLGGQKIDFDDHLVSEGVLFRLIRAGIVQQEEDGTYVIDGDRVDGKTPADLYQPRRLGKASIEALAFLISQWDEDSA